uniref:Uncharacterized protein n=1 Tax=Schizaphis graminum TaxID=13262 RepID=A0A2S2P828_SCHGA
METVEVQESVKDLTREDYDEKLLQLNRRLGASRAEHRQASDALDACETEYITTKERRKIVLGENGRLISERQKSVDGLTDKKQRLEAEVNGYWALVDALYERRKVQYEKMLTRLKEDTDFVRTRYETATQRIEQRAAIMDKITRELENSSNLKQKQKEGMYAKRQILACSMYEYTEELEKYYGKYFETELSRFNDIRNRQLIQNISEYYNIYKRFNEYRRNYIPSTKYQELDKLYERKLKTTVNLQIMQAKIKAEMSKKVNFVPEKSVDLHQEQSSSKIDVQKENSKHEYEPPTELERLKDVIQLKRKLLENTIQQAITEKESREWKCSYLKKMFDEIRTILIKANQYITDEERPTSYDQTNFEWLLNRGAVKHFSTCKTGYIQTYDYDVELNINHPITECEEQFMN